MNLNIKTLHSLPSQMYFFTFTCAYSLSTTKPFKSFPVSTTKNITSLTSTSTFFLKQDSIDPCSRPKMTTYILFFIFKTITHLWQNFPFTPNYSCIHLKSLWCGSLSINISAHPTKFTPASINCILTNSFTELYQPCTPWLAFTKALSPVPMYLVIILFHKIEFMLFMLHRL